MAETLFEIERRVLGCLLEKEMTQPDSYPMTLNALVSACNQKSNRDPVLDLDESAVHATLEGLRKRGLVSLVLPAPGARTQRYKHEAGAVWTWTPRQRAIMTELLLRGPQTPGELRSRCDRMVSFESLEAATTALESLMEDEIPVVAMMPREPGRSAVRYRHLLYPEDEIPDGSYSPTALPHDASHGPSRGIPENSEAAIAVQEMNDRFAQLEDQMRLLTDRVEGMMGRLKSLEDQWNG
jgi:hypothetical protein